MLVTNLFPIFIVDDNTFIFPSNKTNASSSQSRSQTGHERIDDPSKGDYSSRASIKDGVNITYQGFNIFRKSLVIIAEPLDKAIEFGDNVQIATAMTIDDYFGKDEDENE